MPIDYKAIVEIKDLSKTKLIDAIHDLRKAR